LMVRIFRLMLVLLYI